MQTLEGIQSTHMIGRFVNLETDYTLTVLGESAEELVFKFLNFASAQAGWWTLSIDGSKYIEARIFSAQSRSFEERFLDEFEEMIDTSESDNEAMIKSLTNIGFLPSDMVIIMDACLDVSMSLKEIMKIYSEYIGLGKPHKNIGKRLLQT